MNWEGHCSSEELMSFEDQEAEAALQEEEDEA